MNDGKTILIIEDEAAIRKLLRICLEPEGYKVREAASGADGVLLAAQARPDLVILDLGLPDIDGLEVVRRIREWSPVPIIVLTVRETEQDKVGALDNGADDYLTKPFSTAELLARVRVALRHAQPAENESVVRSGPLVVDLASRVVTVHNTEIRLTSTEYNLLRLLARHVGKVVTHSQILRDVWGPTAVEQRQYLRVYFGQLRRKLRVNPKDPDFIITEPGIGYRLRLIE